MHAFRDARERKAGEKLRGNRKEEIMRESEAAKNNEEKKNREDKSLYLR